jgi:hypothetical protein
LIMVFEYTELSDAPSFNNNAEPFTFRIVLLNTELLEDSPYKRMTPACKRVSWAIERHFG